MSRDPKGESGGINLTAFVGNDPVNFVDPFGLAGYFFGGTGNNREEGVSNVEILYEAWDDASGHGKAYYVPGVFSGYTPDEKKYKFLKKRPVTEGASGKTLGARAEEMIKNLEVALRAGDNEVNLFGFSRGSTTALEFLNMIQDKIDSKNPLYKDININFVALWDVVKTTAHDYRTELPANMKFTHKPLHFIAIDEERKGFFNKEVLDVQGALQIGYRGVHADVGGFQYTDQPRNFGWISRRDTVNAAWLIGIPFKQKVLDRYKGSVNWKALPSENDKWFYFGDGTRTFPSDMYISPTVRKFGRHTKPYNTIEVSRPEITGRDWYRWAGKNY